MWLSLDLHWATLSCMFSDSLDAVEEGGFFLIWWLVRTLFISSSHPYLAWSKLSKKFIQEHDEVGTSHSVSLPSFRCCYIILLFGFLASSQMGKKKDVGVLRVCERKRSLLGGSDVPQRTQVGQDPTLRMVTICAVFRTTRNLWARSRALSNSILTKYCDMYVFISFIL